MRFHVVIFGIIVAVCLLVMESRPAVSEETATDAATRGNTALLRHQIKGGIDANTSLPNGHSLLMLASGNGHLDSVRFLLAHGAHPNNRSDPGFTALMSASAGGHADVVKALLDTGASMSGVTIGGNTAIDIARDNGHPDVAEMLQARRATPPESHHSNSESRPCKEDDSSRLSR